MTYSKIDQFIALQRSWNKVIQSVYHTIKLFDATGDNGVSLNDFLRFDKQFLGIQTFNPILRGVCVGLWLSLRIFTQRIKIVGKYCKFAQKNQKLVMESDWTYAKRDFPLAD